VNYTLSYPTGSDNSLWKVAKIIRASTNTLGGLEIGTIIEAQTSDIFDYSVRFAVPDGTSKIHGMISIKLDGRNLRYYDIAEFTIPSVQRMNSLTVSP
jgi:hypothetical protein